MPSPPENLSQGFSSGLSLSSGPYCISVALSDQPFLSLPSHLISCLRQKHRLSAHVHAYTPCTPLSQHWVWHSVGVWHLLHWTEQLQFNVCTRKSLHFPPSAHETWLWRTGENSWWRKLFARHENWAIGMWVQILLSSQDHQTQKCTIKNGLFHNSWLMG